jgi:hypothetical protein
MTKAGESYARGVMQRVLFPGWNTKPTHGGLRHGRISLRRCRKWGALSRYLARNGCRRSKRLVGWVAMANLEPVRRRTPTWETCRRVVAKIEPKKNANRR